MTSGRFFGPEALSLSAQAGAMVSGAAYLCPPTEYDRSPEGPFANIWKAGKADFRESDHRILDGTATAIMAGTLAIGGLRLPMVLMPEVMADTLQHTHSAIGTGAVTGALFGAWCASAGEALNQGISRYPTAAQAAKDNFPSFANVLSHSFPGLEIKGKTGSMKSANRLGNFVLSHVRRGAATVAIGLAPYVMTDHIKGTPKSEIRKLTVTSGIDATVVIGLGSGLVAEAIISIGHNHPKLAHILQNDLSNPKLWGAVAGSLMLTEGATKLLKARKASA